MDKRWAFNSATVKNLPWAQELELLVKHKWSYAEVWQDKFAAAVAQGQATSFGQLAQQMRDVGVEPAGACAGVLGTTKVEIDPVEELDRLQKLIDFTAEVGAGSLAVVFLGPLGEDVQAEYDAAVTKLQKAGKRAADQNIKLSLEFLGGLPFNGCLNSCIELITRTDLPNVGMLFDLVHYYVSASHIEELTQLPQGKLFRVHIDDVPNLPMESLTNETRCLPGVGRIDVPGLMRQIEMITGYDDVWALEIYDPTYWGQSPETVFADSTRAIEKLNEALASR